MKLLQKPIFTGFMPNLMRKDVTLALSFFLPWKWGEIQNGQSIQEVEGYLKKYFSCLDATTFDSGRSALYFALKTLNVQSGDEVLVQAYTCGVVSNAIIWSGATPVYVDVTNDFTLDAHDLQKKFTLRSKVLIIQHTFGIPADLDALLKIAKENNLTVIEDCAHVIGGTYKGKLLGTFGDIGMLSFGADKALSCGRGGALITNDENFKNKIQSLQTALSYPPIFVTLKQLLTFIIFFINKPFYNLGIGKWFLGIGKKLHVLTRIIEQPEKDGKNLPFFPARLPNALAKILLGQFSHLEFFNARRLEWGRVYSQTLVQTSFVSQIPTEAKIFWLRFPLLAPDPKKLHRLAKQAGILLGDWYNSPIAPPEMDIKKMQYVLGTCPNAERLATKSINLPTHFQLSHTDGQKILELVKQYARQTNHQN